MQHVIPKADIIKRAPRLGAEVRNVRLSDDLPDEVIRAINYLLLEHKVLFLRDQQCLSEVQQERFVVKLGIPASDDKVGTTKSMRSLLKLGSAGNGRGVSQWQHTAVTFDGCTKVSHLRGAISPPYGIDTVWSDMAGAYKTLPLSLRMLADQLWAVHTNNHSGMEGRAAETPKQPFVEVFSRSISETAHPLVLVHPETEKRVLAIGTSVRGFVGLQNYTAQKLFTLLQSYIMAPENTVRWSWMSGDVAIWDSRAAHYQEMNDNDYHRAQGRLTADCNALLSMDDRRRAKRGSAPRPGTSKAPKAHGEMRSRSSPW
ncbi:TauD/TfdA family dioxygenase [Bradyrhizobium sp. CW1]|uniref:TauD/TfdA dioxygenase family protein n=1 Tax=Bradyrhizobium sp. CW1 TaxID=2782686 RepID=UPI001FFFC7F7|nr:TauD/TfdA family dioxygenase [Bradyrhizobium sp. CW1]